MFMFGYDYVNMNIFVTSHVTNVISKPFCKVEPYLEDIIRRYYLRRKTRRKFLEEQVRMCLEPFLKKSLSIFGKFTPHFFNFEGESR